MIGVELGWGGGSGGGGGGGYRWQWVVLEAESGLDNMYNCTQGLMVLKMGISQYFLKITCSYHAETDMAILKYCAKTGKIRKNGPVNLKALVF